MLNKFILKAVPLTVGLMFLSACATTGGSAASVKSVEASEKITEAQTAKDVADQLTSTKTTTKSADGEIICKRISVIGSNFKLKVCATADEWQATSDASRENVSNIQRGPTGPAGSN